MSSATREGGGGRRGCWTSRDKAILTGHPGLRPGWGASLWVCGTCPSLTGQAALAAREMAGWAGRPHPGGLHAATCKRRMWMGMEMSLSLLAKSQLNLTWS